MMAAEPSPDLGQALHDWHAALARGDQKARLAARLLVDILVAGGLDERLEEIQARQRQAQPAPPNRVLQDTRLDDVLRLATQNVTISAELYRRLELQEQRVSAIHATSQSAQAMPPPVPFWRQLVPELLRWLAVMGAVLLLFVLFGVTVGLIYRPKPVHPLLPPPAARLLVPPAELPPDPRPRREEPANVI